MTFKLNASTSFGWKNCVIFIVRQSLIILRLSSDRGILYSIQYSIKIMSLSSAWSNFIFNSGSNCGAKTVLKFNDYLFKQRQRTDMQHIHKHTHIYGKRYINFYIQRTISEKTLTKWKKFSSFRTGYDAWEVRLQTHTKDSARWKFLN